MFREISGEANAVNEEDVSTWMNATLPSLIKNYSPEDIYNANEFDLFFKVLPNKSLAFKDENCHGGKYSKERLSVLLCTNSTGTHKVEPLVIGKSQRSRCFKNIKQFPCAYSNQKRAWMTADRFRKWLADLNSQMKKRMRHILLLQAASMLQTFFSSQDEVGHDFSSSLYTIENAILHNSTIKCKQTTVDSFLCKP